MVRLPWLDEYASECGNCIDIQPFSRAEILNHIYPLDTDAPMMRLGRVFERVSGTKRLTQALPIEAVMFLDRALLHLARDDARQRRVGSAALMRCCSKPSTSWRTTVPMSGSTVSGNAKRRRPCRRPKRSERLERRAMLNGQGGSGEAVVCAVSFAVRTSARRTTLRSARNCRPEGASNRTTGAAAIRLTDS